MGQPVKINKIGGRAMKYLKVSNEIVNQVIGAVIVLDKYKYANKDAIAEGIRDAMKEFQKIANKGKVK